MGADASGSTIWAVVPVKELSRAKQRLASLLSPQERRSLCLAMLWDVLSALKNARGLAGVLVYSPDEDALGLARSLHIDAERGPAGQGQSGAVVGALPLCKSRCATSVLTIPLDTPLLTGAEVDQLIAFGACAALPEPSAIMVPSADGTGTNALLLTPPDALSPHFGPNSLALHTEEAISRGVSYRRCVVPGLGLDVDTPADLTSFLEAAEAAHHPGRTFKLVMASGVAERCRPLPARARKETG